MDQNNDREQERKPNQTVTAPGETSVEKNKISRGGNENASREGDAKDLESFGTIAERDAKRNSSHER